MTSEQRTSISNILVAIGLLIMLVMAIMPLLPSISEGLMTWMQWTYAAGALLVLVGRILGAYNGPKLRIKRLHRLLISSGILYCASAVTMFLMKGTNDWMAFLMAGLFMQIYASVMIDRENKKAEK